jgi:hypothetical protein
MRRAALANWSRLPNHNPPRFYTAWVRRVDFVMSALGPVCSQQQTFPDSVGTSHFGPGVQLRHVLPFVLP